MKQVWIVLAVGACEHGQTPGIAARNPALRVFDVQTPVDPLQQAGPSHLVYRVEVQDDICSPLPPDTVATVAGVEMTKVEDQSSGSCQNLFEIEVGAIPTGDDTVEVRDGSGTVSATLEAGVLAPRTMTAASFDLKNNQTFTITWSHAEDLTNPSFSPLLQFREVFTGNCEAGCFGEQFSTFGSALSTTQISFTPSFGTGAQNGEILVQSSRASGSITMCDARQCSFDLSHSALHTATASF